MRTLPVFASLLLASAAPALADVCDYRPSALISGAGAAVKNVDAADLGAKAVSFYTLTHEVTGATMLGTSAAGASVAGGSGLLGGTSGALGAMAAIATAPATLIAAAVVGTGVAAYEGACYFTVERLKDPEAIRGILKNMEENADPEYLRLTQIDGKEYLLIAKEHDGAGRAIDWTRYRVSKLYIEEGILMHSDLGRNSKIGRVQMVQAETEE
ncbi:MAG: hypothetical protein VX974_05520 [Pseudomonadota bacterium]|nr:hypothetical protein [Pseudomonadota bacterium]